MNVSREEEEEDGELWKGCCFVDVVWYVLTAFSLRSEIWRIA